ncbi:MAG: glycosyltransferase family 2 protein [bacterium]
MKTLVICPVYNERNYIISFIYNVLDYVDNCCHLLILDDYSNDGTRDLLLFISKELSSLRDRFLIIFNESNLGYGDNLLKGFEFGIVKGYDKVLTIDCDFQHLPCYIPIFISLSKKYTFVTGTRYSYNSFKVNEKNIFRYMINKKMVDLLRFFYNVSVTDFFCGFRVYDKELLLWIFNKLSSYKKKEGVCFSYDFPIYLWIDLLNFTDNIKEFPVPFIFKSERDFKGKNTESIRDHYRRVEEYVKKFINYYVYRENDKSKNFEFSG